MKKELKDLLKPVRPILRTDNGHCVVKSCASCAFKTYDNGAMRLCMKGGGHVGSMGLCDEWELHNRYNRLGIGKGKVKNPDYIKYLVAVRMSENAQIAQDIIDKSDVKSIMAIRNDFTEKTGKNVYLTH